MKKLFISLLLVVTTVMSANAMSKYRASREARFLTDKMAWELDLTYDQMEDVYEINYDYFRALVSVYSQYDYAYQMRNEELGYVLTPRQWDRYLMYEYFLTPVRVVGYSWFFPIYNHYRRDRFYYDAPHAYSHYSGLHAHHHDYYMGRRDIHIHSFDHGFKPKSSGNIGRPGGMSRRDANRAYEANPYRGGNGGHQPAPNNGGHQAQPNHGNNGGHQAQPNHGNNGGHQAQPSRGNNNINNGHQTQPNRDNNRDNHQAQPSRGNNSNNNGHQTQPSRSNNRDNHQAQPQTRRGSDQSTQSRSHTNRSQSSQTRQGSSSTRTNSGSTARPTRSQSSQSHQSSTRSNASSNRGGHAGGGRR